MIILNEHELILDEIYQIEVNKYSTIAQYKGKSKRISGGVLFKVISSSKQNYNPGDNYEISFDLNRVLNRIITKL